MHANTGVDDVTPQCQKASLWVCMVLRALVSTVAAIFALLEPKLQSHSTLSPKFNLHAGNN